MLSLHRFRALIFALPPLHLLKLRVPPAALQFRLSSSSSSSTTTTTTTTATVPPMDGGDSFKFGPYKIGKSEVFYSTPLSYSMVNLRPCSPCYNICEVGICLAEVVHGSASDIAGKVLVCPRREVKRFADLTAEETTDLWLIAKAVGEKLERYHQATSLTFTIQDGPEAGQTVPHVHIHIIPRKKGDFEKNDDIYDAIDDKEKELKAKLDLDIERKDRSLDEMAREADIYRALFSSDPRL